MLKLYKWPVEIVISTILLLFSYLKYAVYISEMKHCYLYIQHIVNCYTHLGYYTQKVNEYGIRDSRKAGSLWEMMRGVGGVKKSIHWSWLAKGLGLGLRCWGFKGVQEEIPRDEASTLQIRSVIFPPGQYTSPQLHPCHRLFD